jgi:Asp-tRNA(Asn)/Glu-tRNA(Gln) amidotransferase C subunit
MSDNHLDIDYVANLARLELTETEKAEFGSPISAGERHARR